MEAHASIEVQIVYATDQGLRGKTISIAATDQVISVARGATKEEIVRRTIDQLDGLPRDVMNDMYRQLVWGNYMNMDGKSGKNALSDLDREYPDQGKLPSFKRRPTDNAPGMIVYNLLLQRNEPSVGYLVLADILRALLEAGIWEQPKLGTALPEGV